MSIYETLQLIRVPVCMCAIVSMGHKVPERACGGELANLSAASNHHIGATPVPCLLPNRLHQYFTL